jgi:hypothetical protein
MQGKTARHSNHGSAGQGFRDFSELLCTMLESAG